MLTPVEAGLARIGTPGVCGVTVRGRLDTDALARAVDLLCSWHPVLAGRITATADGLRLTAAPNHSPGPREVTGDACDLDAPFTLDEPLLRVTVAHRPDGTHLLAFAVHHAVSDGMSALTAMSRLWQTYTALVTGGRPTPPPADAGLPRSTEELLADRYPPHDTDAWLARQVAAAAGQPAPVQLPVSTALAGRGSPHGAHLHSTELTGADVVRLYRRAREENTTPAALMCALVMLAARARLAPEPGPLPLALGCTVDLRSRLVPPIPRHRMVQASSLVPVTAPVDTSDTLGAVARTVAGRLASALAGASAERQLMVASRMLSGAASLPFTAMLSNLAICPLRLSPPPDTAVSRLFAYAPPPGPGPTLFITRTRETMGLHLATPRSWFDDAQAAGLAQALTGRLAMALVPHMSRDPAGPTPARRRRAKEIP
ncbi:hypothetical protein STVIR_8725 [Streptomyces viridochromogenes Tue57]|uniref:Phthiocerol/phthiodiolone dimycocerosyl transferase n=1 Tax=Streptomyces viridochromogenes Tue57 TaxID=1160705 RepID=L8NYH6_STRVR|nr:hypothetical protein STVIR_8725 [Streptomyces viridochromogenes Tue57]